MSVSVQRMPPLKATSLNGSLTSLSWLQKLGCITSGLKNPLASPSQPVVHHIYRAQKEAASRKKASQKQLNKKAAEAAAAAAVAAGDTATVFDFVGCGGCGGATPSVGSASELSATIPDDPALFDPTVDWNASTTEKPPHCYATLIYMAVQSLKKEKVTLGEIYHYVKTHFAYYRANDNGWKNSIRHNLTQHDCFIKVQRTEEHPGKGGYWQLATNHGSMFKNGVFKRKRRKVAPSGSHTGIKLAGNGGCGKPNAALKLKIKRPYKVKTESESDAFVWPGISVLGACSDMSDIDGDVEALDGIDWHSMIPDSPPDVLSPASFTPSAMQMQMELQGGQTPRRCDSGSGADGGGLNDSSSMLSALTLMETSAGSPVSILPDINQNDGSCKPASPSFTLNELHGEVSSHHHMGAKGASLLRIPMTMTISQQLKQVESTLDLSGNLSAFEQESGDDTLAWNGEDLTVRGIGISILADGIVPDMKMKYTHITPDDLDDFDASAPMPVDWCM